MSLPKAFVETMRGFLDQEWPDFLAAMAEPAPVSLRLNPARGLPGPDLESVRWQPFGYYLPERPVFTLDPLLHSGAYYVQEASSMIIGEAFCQTTPDGPLRVLDLCAAPGGKSNLLASLLPPDSLLVANEVIKSRAWILQENLQKWGHPTALVSQQDPADFVRLPGFFDVILVDAPCSGEGMFRKDPGAREQWSPDHVKLCADRQLRILADVWPALKSGGVLLYSTCTYNGQENEGVLERLLQTHSAEGLPLTFPPEWNIRQFDRPAFSGFRLMPHLVRGEGLFVAALRKTESSSSKKSRKKDRKSPVWADKQTVAKAQAWVDPTLDGRWLQQGEDLSFLPDALKADWWSVLTKAHLVPGSGELLQLKKKNLVPQPALAHSRWRNRELVEPLDLEQAEALRFLRRESIGATGARGWRLAHFAGQPLGWLKWMGNRSNNYYPQNWRIRMDIPQETEWFSLMNHMP
ncbi:MAG: rRNA methyltransferase [Bacteroidota bacterium]